MGYLTGRAATEAMLGIQGDITKESVNEAFKNLKNVQLRSVVQAVVLRQHCRLQRVEQHGHHRHAAGRQDGADRGLLRDRRARCQPVGADPRQGAGARTERLTSPSASASVLCALRSHCEHISGRLTPLLFCVVPLYGAPGHTRQGEVWGDGGGVSLSRLVSYRRLREGKFHEASTAGLACDRCAPFRRVR